MKNRQHYRTICIGGGAAGLFFSALTKDSLLIEKMDAVGKKLLLTGGGKCNFTRAAGADELSEGFFEKKNFVSPCLHAFPPERIREYFDSH